MEKNTHNASFSCCLLEWNSENLKLCKKNLAKSYWSGWEKVIDHLKILTVFIKQVGRSEEIATAEFSAFQS